MGEIGFNFPVSQGFQSPQAALLHKARCLEGKQETESFEPCAFVFLNGESDDSSGDDQKMQASSSSSPPNPALSPPHLPQPVPGNNRKKMKKNPEQAVRYAFKTRSESDNLQDGYKWRKYGKKSIKNSPNPRNYYRCSYDNCNVKKRVERDSHDKGVVITTYEGNHNHENPSVVYYIESPSIVVKQQPSCLEHFPSPLSYTSHFMFMNTT